MVWADVLVALFAPPFLLPPLNCEKIIYYYMLLLKYFNICSKITPPLFASQVNQKLKYFVMDKGILDIDEVQKLQESFLGESMKPTGEVPGFLGLPEKYSSQEFCGPGSTDLIFFNIRKHLAREGAGFVCHFSFFLTLFLFVMWLV